MDSSADSSSILAFQAGLPYSWHELFQKQVKRNPNQIAVKLPDGQAVTYGELDFVSNQIANYFLSVGLGRGMTIATCLPREGLESVSWILGALKIGACAFQLEPSLDFRLLKEKLGLIKPESVLSWDPRFTKFIRSGPALPKCRPILIDPGAPNPAASMCGRFSPAKVSLDDPAFLIMSSGSTGKPKIMTIPYRPFPNLADASSSLLELGPGRTLLQLANKNFDAATFELMAPLATGAALALIREDVRLDSKLFLGALRLHAVDTLLITPSHAGSLARQAEKENAAADGIKNLMLIGEAFDDALIDQLSAWGVRRIYNSYGPSEIGFWATTKLVYEREPGHPEGKRYSIDIGTPIRGVRCLVMRQEKGSRAWKPCGPREEGHLFLHSGVDQVYRDAELNRLKYVKLRAGKQTLSYLNTGDIVRRKGHKLFFVGRKDNQVKIHGQLVVTDEVASGLEQMAREFFPDLRLRWLIRPHLERSRCLGLEAYLSAENQEVASRVVSELLPRLSARMERHKIPSSFFWVTDFRAKAGGKLDTAHILEMAKRVPFAAPRAGLAPLVGERVDAIWKKHLATKTLLPSDSFFGLGGDSLTAISAAAEIARALELDPFQVRAILFQSHSLADCCQKIAAAAETPKAIRLGQRPRLVRLRDRENIPASVMQAQLLYAAKLEPGSPAYNEPATLNFGAFVDKEAIELALRRVIHRHEILRTSFGYHEAGHYTQVIASQIAETFELGFDDLRRLAPHQQEEVGLALARQDLMKTFDLEKAPLFRARLIRTEQKQDRLFFCFHHAIMDGQTMGIFIRELESQYLVAAGLASPKPLDWTSIQYADFAAWHYRHVRRLEKEQLAFWEHKLAGSVRESFTPSPSEVAKPSSDGTVKTFLLLPAHEVESLKALSKAEGVTLFTTLMTAYKILIFRRSGRNDITVGTVVSLRNQSGLMPVMGNMLNLLALRTILPRHGEFRDYLGAVKKACADAQAHQDVPFFEVVKRLRPEREEDRIPFFQTAFILEPPLPKTSLGWSWSQMELHSGAVKVELSFELDEREEGILGRIEHKRSSFSEAFVIGLLEEYRGLLKRLIHEQGMSIPKAQADIDKQQIKKTIARIFSQLIFQEEEMIPERTEFHQLGGDSLKSIVLIDKINKAFSLSLTLSELRKKLTIGELSDEVAGRLVKSGGASSPEALSLVSLKEPASDEMRTLFFFIHPGDGSTRVFQAISQKFPSHWAVFGLRAPGSEIGESVPALTVEQYAKRYSNLVANQQPVGPIKLGSFCAGSLIALAMVPQLEQMGRKVESLVLVDCPAPQHRGTNIDAAQRLHDYFRMSAGLMLSPESIRAISSEAEEQLRYIVRTGLSLGKISKSFEYYQSHLRALLNLYRPEGTKDIIINSFRSVFGVEISSDLRLQKEDSEDRLVERLMVEGKKQKRIPEDLRLEFFTQICEVANAINKAVRDYVPSKISAETRVLFFYTKPSRVAPMPWYSNPDSWSDFIPNLIPMECDGDHFSVLTRDVFVDSLYEKISLFHEADAAASSYRISARLS